MKKCSNLSSCICQCGDLDCRVEMRVDSLIKKIEWGRYDSVRAAVTGAVTVGRQGRLLVYWTDTGSRTGWLLYRPGLTLLQRPRKKIDSGTETLSLSVPSHFSWWTPPDRVQKTLWGGAAWYQLASRWIWQQVSWDPVDKMLSYLSWGAHTSHHKTHTEPCERVYIFCAEASW